MSGVPRSSVKTGSSAATATVGQAIAIHPLQNDSNKRSRVDVVHDAPDVGTSALPAQPPLLAGITPEQMEMLFGKHLGKDDCSAQARKHVSSCIDSLSRKVEKSLRLSRKRKGLIDQCNELAAGRIPAGVRPFKVAVDVAELDGVISPEIKSLTINFEPHLTYREAKEKLYTAATTMTKFIDSKVIEAQLQSIRVDLSSDAFIKECNNFSERRATATSDLMTELGLHEPVPSDPPQLPRAKLMALYTGVMDKVADNRMQALDREAKQQDSVAKKVEKLRNTKPHDLLEAKIRQSVSAIVGKKSNVDKTVDYGKAYSMVQADREDLLPEAIRPPPGLENEQVFPKGRKKAKEKEKQEVPDKRLKWKGKGKGKGTGDGGWKSPKGKGKHPKKHSSQEQKPKKGKGKGKAGKKGKEGGWQSGKKSKGKNGKGGGESWRR